MGVLDPVRVVIENYPEAQTEEFEIVNNPEDAAAGTRRVPFSRELFIEREDFMEAPPKKFFRLAPGREVRLRGAYFVTCTGVEKDASGAIAALRCTYDAATRGGDAPDGRLFSVEQPGAERNFREDLNLDSLQVRRAKLEPSAAAVQPGDRYQFERLGYFCVDPDTQDGKLVFNRTVTLKDSWARIANR
jgi:glutaminyl-tRNA synthetase